MKRTKGTLIRTKGTINFRLKNDSPKDEKPIRLDFSYGKRFRYSIGYSVNPKYWNKEKQRIKNVAIIRNSNEINDLMRDLESELEKFVAECDANQVPLSNKLMKEQLDAFTNKGIVEETEPNEITLIDWAEKYINNKIKELKGGVKSQTVKSYKQTLGILVDFQKYTSYELKFENIDSEFYSEFIDYMNNRKHKGGVGYSVNTIGKHIKSIKTFLNSSLHEDLHSNYKFRKFIAPSEVTTAIYLTLEELDRLAKFDLSKTRHYELARDIFVIGCEIGQRISDYKDMSNHEIVDKGNDKFIRIKQMKTSKKVLCKITPIISTIMNQRYDGGFPSKITEQKLNQYIKEVAKIVGIDEEVKIERTQGGKRLINYIPKCDLVMGHTARRTFCTLKYKAGVSVHNIMELSGHTTEKEFLKYIRNPKEERVMQITDSDAFKSACVKI